MTAERPETAAAAGAKRKSTRGKTPDAHRAGGTTTAADDADTGTSNGDDPDARKAEETETTGPTSGNHDL